ncbi:hypothetical protein EON65_45240 [archaeon]|nr:MAG: hypothetical protein EON65_45240 [archaeon]
MNLPPLLSIPVQGHVLDPDHVLPEIPEGDGEDPAQEEVEEAAARSPRKLSTTQTPHEPTPITRSNPPSRKHRKVVQIANKDKKKDEVAGTSKDNGEDGDDGNRPAESATTQSSPSTLHRSPRNKSNKLKVPSKAKASTDKYSSSRTDEPGENEGVLAYEQMRRTQAMFMQTMSYTLDTFKKTTEKYEQMHRVVQKKLRRINKHGNAMLQQCEAYSHMEYLSQEVAHQLWEEKQYHRMNVMSVKMQYFKVDGELGHFGSSTSEELRKVRAMAVEAEEQAQVKSLLEVKWFLLATAKLRDFMRRMNNSVPMCTLKMLIVLKYLIVLGFKVSIEMFYFILLSSIFQEEDFRKNIVNQIIEVVRVGLDIKPEDFLTFLDSNKIQPHPELMNEIRMLAVQKSPQAGTVKFKFPPTPSGMSKSPMYAEDERGGGHTGVPSSPLASTIVVVESYVAITDMPLLELPPVENAPKDGILASDT